MLLPPPFGHIFYPPFGHIFKEGYVLPHELLLAYYAKNPLVSKRGPYPTWSYADESDPLVIDGGVYCGPGYTNGASSLAKDYLASNGTYIDSVYTGSIVDTQHFIRDVNGISSPGIWTIAIVARSTTMHLQLMFTGVSSSNAYANFNLSDGSVAVDALGNAYIQDLGDGWYRCSYRCSFSDSASAYFTVCDDPLAARFGTYAGTGETIEFKEALLAQSPYLHPYIPPGTSAVSRAGTVGGNGIGFDTSGTQEVVDGVELWDVPTRIDADWSDNGDKTYTCDGSDIGKQLEQADVFIAQEKYRVSLVVSGRTSGTLVLYIGQGGQLISTNVGSTDGVYTYDVIVTAAVPSKLLFLSSGFTGTTSNISVQKLQTIPEPKSLALRQAFEGKPDGVELATTPAVERSGFEYDTFTSDVGSMSGTTSDALTAIAGFQLNGNIGDRIKVSAGIVVSGVCSLQRRDSFIGPPTPVVEPVTTGQLVFEHTITEVAPVLTFTYNTGQTGTISVTNFSVQKLNPAICTATALVTMGVGSDEVASNLNILSCIDVVTNLLYYAEENTLVKSYDGSNTRYIPSAWDRGEHHLKIVQTNADGTQFRVGNKRYNPDGSEIDSDIQWSAWVAFDGSFDPLDYLRLALTNTVPLSVKALEVWGKSASDDEILKYMERELPNA